MQTHCIAFFWAALFNSDTKVPIIKTDYSLAITKAVGVNQVPVDTLKISKETWMKVEAAANKHVIATIENDLKANVIYTKKGPKAVAIVVNDTSFANSYFAEFGKKGVTLDFSDTLFYKLWYENPHYYNFLEEATGIIKSDLNVDDAKSKLFQTHPKFKYLYGINYLRLSESMHKNFSKNRSVLQGIDPEKAETLYYINLYKSRYYSANTGLGGGGAFPIELAKSRAKEAWEAQSYHEAEAEKAEKSGDMERAKRERELAQISKWEAAKELANIDADPYSWKKIDPLFGERKTGDVQKANDFKVETKFEHKDLQDGNLINISSGKFNKGNIKSQK